MLTLDPNNAAAHQGLGLALWRQERPAEAFRHYKQALESAPGQGQYWLGYIEVLISAGLWDSARKILQQGKAHGLAGARLQELEARIAAIPDETRLQPLRQAVNQGDYARAKPLAEALMRECPEHGFAYKMLGGVALAQGDDAVALPLLQKAAQLLPLDAENLNNLGIALGRQGQANEAVAQYRKALDLVPDFAAAHNNLGSALKYLCARDESIQAFRTALKLQPDYPDALTNLAQACHDDGRLDEARVHVQNALRLDPAHANAHLVMGKLLEEQEDFPGALDHYQQAVRHRPNLAEAHLYLGNLYKQWENPAAADASFRRALELDPHQCDALVALADMVLDRGEFAQAREMLERALQINPGSVEATALLARVRKMTPEDSAWRDAALALSKGSLSLRSRATLLYAVAKFFDDVADYDRAFEHLHQANSCKKQLTPRYDRDNQERLVGYLIQHYQAPIMALPGASESARPLFIVGMPRSGTSLMEQVLSSHPEVFGAGELRFWNDQMKAHKLAYVHNRYTDAAVGALVSGCLENLDRHHAQALRVVDKMPGNFLALGMIHRVFPQARILHAMRNPIDTCLSIYFQNFNLQHTYANDLEDLAHYWRQYHRLIAHWRQLLPQEVFLDVPYEALIEDQEGWSRRIIDFIGLDWDDRCLEFHKTKRKVGTASNWQARQPIYKSSKERWRNYEQHLGPLLPLAEWYDLSWVQANG
ncbi:sulfotransferase [Magnetovirga frankeli]|uniref:tetratricopeptide repeat-containing sulfotransferase family protein n=1 Tax=Magnetovirga frankeli TaxID=947516 RepID=UPI001AFC9DD7|nr:sulfotransferase [gamma proteobacterium SS-5]